MLPFFVYILKCADGSYYTGHTDNLEQRISGHELGKIACYATARLPVELVFAQQFATRAEAINAEHRIKKWSRVKKEALIKEEWNKLKESARGRTGYMKKDQISK